MLKASPHPPQNRSVSALGRLEREGLVEDLGGNRGRTVRRRLRIGSDMSNFELGAYIDDRAHRTDQWQAGVRAAGWTPRQIIDSVRELEVPAQIVEYLGLD